MVWISVPRGPYVEIWSPGWWCYWEMMEPLRVWVLWKEVRSSNRTVGLQSFPLSLCNLATMRRTDSSTMCSPPECTASPQAPKQKATNCVLKPPKLRAKINLSSFFSCTSQNFVTMTELKRYQIEMSFVDTLES